MTFLQQLDHVNNATNQDADSPAPANQQSLRTPFSDYGWSLDSIAHLVLFVPFAAATIITLSALDWSAFTSV